MAHFTLQLKSPTGQVILTDLTDKIQEVLERDGFEWFEALKSPIELSEEAFKEIESLVTPP